MHKKWAQIPVKMTIQNICIQFDPTKLEKGKFMIPENFRSNTKKQRTKKASPTHLTPSKIDVSNTELQRGETQQGWTRDSLELRLFEMELVDDWAIHLRVTFATHLVVSFFACCKNELIYLEISSDVIKENNNWIPWLRTPDY